MSTPNSRIQAGQRILDFYTQHAKDFGNSSQGVGWKDDNAQLIRFAQLTKVILGKEKFSINDLGCGAGHFYNYLISENYFPAAYKGYDILDEMIELAKGSLLPNSSVTLNRIQSASEMNIADYTIASGIFNVKYEAEETEWLRHILTTLETMHNKSSLGFAFNLLTKYSDKELMQAYLYYADPLFLFDYCKKNFSKNVALLHDYFQYDFTVIVRKN